MCLINGKYKRLENSSYLYSYGICPLVSLKPGIELELENKIEIVDEETIAENPSDYYGKEVTNYTAGGLTYRVFYADKNNDYGDGENTIYIKSDFSYNLKSSLSLDINSLTESDLTTYKRMNKSWTAERGTNTSNWNYNERAAAWLSAPSQWTTYFDNTRANYAIGSPSVEMYVKSYNQIANLVGNYTLGATYRATRTPGYVYTVNGKESEYFSGGNTLTYEGYNSMYAGIEGIKSGQWFLSSPSSCGTEIICGVSGESASLTNCSRNDAIGICPLVSIKKGTKLIVSE